MSKKITYTNGFRAMASLRKAAADPRVEEIEGHGMDEGRVFVHLVKGYWMGELNGTHSFSCGSAAELKRKMADIEVESE